MSTEQIRPQAVDALRLLAAVLDGDMSRSQRIVDTAGTSALILGLSEVAIGYGGVVHGGPEGFRSRIDELLLEANTDPAEGGEQ